MFTVSIQPQTTSTTVLYSNLSHFDFKRCPGDVKSAFIYSVECMLFTSKYLEKVQARESKRIGREGG